MSDNRPLRAPVGDDGAPVLQVERLDAVVNHALSSENWNQGAWMKLDREATSCGTSYCIAGFAAVEFAGAEPRIRPWSTYVDEVIFDGEESDIEDAARSYLGLTWDESEQLFDAKNTAEDVREVVEAIKEGYYR